MKASKNALVLGGMALLALLGSGGAGYYQYTKLDAASVRVKELRTKVEENQNAEADLAKLQAEVVASQEKLNHLEQGVPARAYIPTMMKELETIGHSNGIDVLGVRPMAPKFGGAPVATGEDGEKAPPPKAYDEQLIEVKGTGAYLKVLAFLAALETFPKIVAVSQVTLMPRETNNGDAESLTGPTRLEVTVELRAYLFPNNMPKADKVAAMGGNYGQS